MIVSVLEKLRSNGVVSLRKSLFTSLCFFRTNARYVLYVASNGFWYIYRIKEEPEGRLLEAFFFFTITLCRRDKLRGFNRWASLTIGILDECDSPGNTTGCLSD